MNNDYYILDKPENCFAKSYKKDNEIYFETYNSHIEVCKAFLEKLYPITNIYKKYDINYLNSIVINHDIGKRGKEFQESIKNKEQQYIRHEELAFILWLNEHDELRNLETQQILSILAHHKTLIDDDSAIMIEQYIATHPNFENLWKKWLDILKTPREKRIDKIFLDTLPLIDILRTIDILASYTTETVFKKYFGLSQSNSLYESSLNDLSRELCSVNLKSDEIDFKEPINDTDIIKIQITNPIKVEIEFKRKKI